MITNLTNSETTWARKIWISYWYIIGVQLLAQLFSYLFLPYDAQVVEFYYYVLLFPTLKMSATVGLAWIVNKYFRKYSFHTLVVAGTILAILIIRLNTDIRIISALFLLPILVSVIFYRSRLTFFSAILQLLGFILLYIGDESYRSHLSDFDLVAIPCFIGACTLLAINIMSRGRELQEALLKTMTAKQELMIQYAIMRKQAQIDSLTHLYNQASFYEHFDMALTYSGERSSSFFLALLDIDNFKTINDTFGHLIGDVVLSRVAQIIKETISSNDIAARYGGEEFALLLFETDVARAIKLVETIRTTLSSTKHEEMGGKVVTISIGITSYEPGMSKETLFEKADKKLYKAKNSGKNRTVT
ncbi:hypothetical protein GCM10008018_64010 [Paenibacillus marchantiophytorum]|uniref:GGDEF domain-containing protein n=1 Tax=Paenibacillus marchantiophytorum TaxID=1619310 RepID=A0ABQ1FF87_9BACL|nr:GGDEF domain-containing protein [Paenibacillus marchantiophytorum]GGA09646.1 hypothetical protein GCM10008018_64010 [Paenibacillus marchantiophytorum]